MIEGNNEGGGLSLSFSCLITSSGCSNMLRDRRNCLRGLPRGLDDFLTWLAIGEPLREETPEAVKLGRERGGANAGAAIRGAALSWTGELSKISDSDSEEAVAGLLEKLPLPKRKGGSWLSGP